MIDKEFLVEGQGSVEVRFASGRLNVVEGAPGKIRVTVDGSTSDLTIEQVGSLITVGTRKSGFLVSSRYRITVEAPHGTNISASVASADVQCDIKSGQFDIKTASGDVRFTHTETLTAHTASGDIHGTSTGVCNLVSASGDLHLDSASGKVSASTASGDIYVNHATADVNASSLSGDVIIGRFEGENLKAKAVSGNVKLGIPAGTEVNLDANSLSGNIRLPEPSAENSPRRSHADISVSLVSGDLTIKRV